MGRRDAVLADNKAGIIQRIKIRKPITYHHYDAETEETTLSYHQDVENILEENKAVQNMGFDKSSDMWLAASIPLVVQMEWITKYGIDVHDPNLGGLPH